MPKKVFSRFNLVPVGFTVVLLAWTLVPGCNNSSPTPEESFAQAMKFTRPDDRIVFDRNWAKPKSSDYVVMPKKFSLGTASVLKAPDCWVNLAKETGRSLPAWTPLIFLHGRQAAGSNEERLVALELESRFTGDGFWSPGPELWVVVRVLERNNQGRVAVLHTNESALDLGAMQFSKIFAGQSDPADPSHFVIKFEGRGASADAIYPGRVDGWLQKDCSVRLTKKD
ncbi:MAG: hypothetical protein K8S55_13680 [Phycisphaerae bacterium]|nr:hypothetical protein [Phycisphaerae bacterium]